MTWDVSREDERCSFNWWRRRASNVMDCKKGQTVTTLVKAEPLRRQSAPGRMEVRRLRAGVFRIGASLGLQTRMVVRFSEAISGKRWRRCHRYDLEQVLADLAEVRRRMRMDRETEGTSR
jgi:hypothetical protein